MKKSLLTNLALTFVVLGLLSPLAAFAADFDLGTILSTLGAFKQPQVLAFTMFAIAGVLVHVQIDIGKGNIIVASSGSWFATLFNYMFKQKLSASIAMLFGAVALGSAYLAITPQPISWWQLLLAGATAGYTSDSLFNRSSAPPAA